MFISQQTVDLSGDFINALNESLEASGFTGFIFLPAKAFCGL
jgi:hypothetical protein